MISLPSGLHSSQDASDIVADRHGVVRNLRDLAGFTKVHLAPGQSSVVELPLRLCDLARYDEDASSTNRKGAAVTGAYVVDGGDYTFCEQRSAWADCCRDSDSRLLLRTGELAR